MNTSPDANRRRKERVRAPEGRLRPGGGRRRWLLLAGAAVCLAAAGLVAANRLHSPRAARQEAPTPPAGGPPPAAPAPPTPAGTPATPATAQELRDEAFAVVRQLIADCPESADAVSLMGTVHFAFKNPDEAEKWWYKALELDPKRAGNYTVLATAAAIRGDLDRAAELWRQAQTLAPDRPGVYSGYAAVLLTTGKPDEAIAAIEKELALSPANPRCFALLGKAHLQRQDYEKAVENYCRAMEGGQADPAVCYGLAAAYARLGRKDKAEECVQRFQALRAQQGQAGVQDKERGHIDLAVSTDVLVMVLGDAGQTYAEHRNLPKAETCWRRAAAIDPKNQGCRYSLVQLYGATGRPREAVSVCEELRAAAPGSAANETYIGVLLARSGQFDAAEAALRKAIELDPKSPAACRCLVQLLLGRDRVLPEAKAQAARLVELEPSAPHYLLLGQACSRAGDLPAARAAVERALRLEPDNKAVQEASRALQERR